MPPRVSRSLLDALSTRAAIGGGPREIVKVEAPFSGRGVGEVLAASRKDVERAIERGRQAQQAWRITSMRERTRVLLRLHDLLFERMQEGMDIIQLESGKARMDAFIELMDVAIVARYYAFHSAGTLGTRRRAGFLPGLTQTEVAYRPKGVVGVIAPWNYPLTIAISDSIPALMAGNAVVIKPAELTPYSALWGAGLLQEAGVPPELVQVVPGYGPEAGEALVDSADFVHFTGSTEVGRQVGARAAENLTDVSLELGGKNPLIVRRDADLGRIIPGIIQACYSCAGQLCVSAERILVHESIKDEFIDRLIRAVSAMELNARYDFSASMGSLASREQLEKVSSHVEEAREKGATVLVGGEALPEIGPLFYSPTLLEGVTPEMSVFAEETFGPVASISTFVDDDDAVRQANDTPYGLHASIWCRDIGAAKRVAAQLHAGTVSINDAYVSVWGSTAAPMGGFKSSGMGRRHGPEGLLKYTEPQSISTQLLGPLAPHSLGVSQQAFAAVTERVLRAMRYLPGIR